MTNRADSVRVAHPLFQVEGSGSTPTSALQLIFNECSIEHARECNRLWHSRLPKTNRGPWQFSFSAVFGDKTYAVALWHNPSGRCLPSHWLELRRMAIAPDAPKNTASRFLGWMARWFRSHCPERERMISYQDTSVHEGTIYKAAGWIAAYVSKRTGRDRSKSRKGTRRLYRWDDNGRQVEESVKVRWEKIISA